MTAAFAEAAGGDGPFARFASTAAHRPLLVGGTLAVLYVALPVALGNMGLTGHLRAGLLWPGNPAVASTGTAVSFVAFVAFALWGIAAQVHFIKLCERCSQEIPVDPQTAVNKRKRSLRLIHLLMDNRPRLYAGMVGLCVVNALLAHFGAYLAADTLTAVLFLAVPTLVGVHTRLQPWCPWCRWGDGGDEEPSPDPDPIPSAERELT